MVEENDISYSISSFLQDLDRRFQIPPQPVKALVPLNPYRLPGHILATGFSDNMRFGKESLLRPIENLQVSLEYLASSQTDAHYNSRFGQVCHDTAIINILSETCGAPGEMIAGDYANQAADEYVEQMIEDQDNPLEDDEIARSYRLRLRGGQGSCGDPAGAETTAPLFDGVGLFKEHLPAESRTNPFTQLPRCRRANDRPLWTYKFFTNGRSGFIVQRCYYTVYLVKYINHYLKSKVVNIILCPISYTFYCISIYYMVRYLSSEVYRIKGYLSRRQYRFKVSKFIYSKFIFTMNSRGRRSRSGLF